MKIPSENKFKVIKSIRQNPVIALGLWLKDQGCQISFEPRAPTCTFLRCPSHKYRL